MHSHSCCSRADCLGSDSANRCATAAVQQGWWFSFLVTCSERVINACSCVASTWMICLHDIVKTDHLCLCNSRVALLCARWVRDTKSYKEACSLLASTASREHHSSLFNSTNSARSCKVLDLPMQLIGGLQDAAALSCQSSGY